MKKLCFVTATRAEYGLLKWIMRDIIDSHKFIFQLAVTGGHLLKEQGYTVQQIIDDGFDITAYVNCKLNTESREAIAVSMGRIAELFARTFSELCPDYLVVLGDRYELLPICNTAFVMNIPIIHLSGGDVTEGAIDDGIRNAITMLAEYHFPGNAEAARNIERMRGSSEHIWNIGEPGLDAFHRVMLMRREELADNLGLDAGMKWGLMTYHAETQKSLEHNLQVVHFCVEALQRIKECQVVMTYANADYGGRQINEFLEKTSAEKPRQFKVFPSLGSERYLNFMRETNFVIGNSSSGIVEAPFLKIPVVNIGDRQLGRHLCGNVIQTEPDLEGIIRSIHKALGSKIIMVDADYWGDGHAAEKFVKVIDQVINGE